MVFNLGAKFALFFELSKSLFFEQPSCNTRNCLSDGGLAGFTYWPSKSTCCKNIMFCLSAPYNIPRDLLHPMKPVCNSSASTLLGGELRDAHSIASQKVSYLDKIKITCLFCQRARSEHSASDGSSSRSSASQHEASSRSCWYTVRGHASAVPACPHCCSAWQSSAPHWPA